MLTSLNDPLLCISIMIQKSTIKNNIYCCVNRKGESGAGEGERLDFASTLSFHKVPILNHFKFRFLCLGSYKLCTI